jgi:hypothetical protein
MVGRLAGRPPGVGRGCGYEAGDGLGRAAWREASAREIGAIPGEGPDGHGSSPKADEGELAQPSEGEVGVAGDAVSGADREEEARAGDAAWPSASWARWTTVSLTGATPLWTKSSLRATPSVTSITRPLV